MNGLAEAVMAPVEVRAVFEIDDELRASILRPRHLAELGATHETAESLEKARSALHAVGERQRRHLISLAILLDLMFPEDYSVEEAISFIREIRSGNLGVHPCTPIVVLSNAKSPDTMDAAFSAGANDFFSKTDDPQSILKQVGFYLGQEILEYRRICEVGEINLAAGKIRVRLRADERWILERWIPVSFCPPDVRVNGGAFYWDTLRCFRDYSVQYVSKATVIEDDGGKAVESLLNPGI
jgi:CheY-like chemotaxis protein